MSIWATGFGKAQEIWRQSKDKKHEKGYVREVSSSCPNQESSIDVIFEDDDPRSALAVLKRILKNKHATVDSDPMREFLNYIFYDWLGLDIIPPCRYLGVPYTPSCDEGDVGIYDCSRDPSRRAYRLMEKFIPVIEGRIPTLSASFDVIDFIDYYADRRGALSLYHFMDALHYSKNDDDRAYDRKIFLDNLDQDNLAQFALYIMMADPIDVTPRNLMITLKPNGKFALIHTDTADNMGERFGVDEKNQETDEGAIAKHAVLGFFTGQEIFPEWICNLIAIKSTDFLIGKLVSFSYKGHYDGEDVYDFGERYEFLRRNFALMRHKSIPDFMMYFTDRQFREDLYRTYMSCYEGKNYLGRGAKGSWGVERCFPLLYSPSPWWPDE